jgi:hypothetical protein
MKTPPRNSFRGFTLIETAIVLVITGLMVQVLVHGRALLNNARVKDIVAQQSAVESAFVAFQDRFGKLPGDYSAANTNLPCGSSPCLNGDGNGRIEAGSEAGMHEEILAWNHLAAAGFLRGDYRMVDLNTTLPGGNNTPTNVFGGYLEIAADNNWGFSANTVIRHNIKTGNYIPAAVLAEVDRKIDDGRPGSGRFQFSGYAGNGAGLPIGGMQNGCTDANSTTAAWIQTPGSENCGAATLLY